MVVICRRVYVNNTRLSRTRARVAPHACHAKTETRSQEGLERSLPARAGFAYPREGPLEEREKKREERWREAREEGGSHVTSARVLRSSAESSRPNLTYPR